MFSDVLISPVLAFQLLAGSLIGGIGPGSEGAEAEVNLTPDRQRTIPSSQIALAANQPPLVMITAPGDKTVVRAGTDLAMLAMAADPEGVVVKVEFFQGRKKLGEDRSAPYTLTWNVPAGRHTLRARARDNQGGVATSAPVTLTARSR